MRRTDFGGGAAACDEIADDHVQHTPSGKDDGTGCLIVLAIVVVVALGPGKFVLMLEGAWSAVLWGWLGDGGGTAWITAWLLGSAAGLWYSYQVTREAREATAEAGDETRPCS